MRRQPATPNPGGNRAYIRLSSLPPENDQNDLFERPTSDAGRSQRSASNRGGGNGNDNLQRNASRRSLLEPLRPGEEILSPEIPTPPRLPASGLIRPPVPVEPLAPVAEEAPSTGL